MSRNSLILEKTAWRNASATPPSAASKTVPCASEYAELVRGLFPNCTVLAVLDTGSGTRASEACRGIAAEVAASGKRVVMVQVDALLRMSQSFDAAICEPGPVPNVVRWPSTRSAPVGLFPSSAAEPPAGNWLVALRRNFDAILLDCPPPATVTDSASIAAMADAAILVVDGGRTTKQQIQRDQQTLKLRGVKLAGCVLIGNS